MTSRTDFSRVYHDEDSVRPACADECGEVLRRGLAEKGVEAHVTYLPPLVAQVYESLGMVCPHGVAWYAEPTTEQIAQWAKAGVE